MSHISPAALWALTAMQAGGAAVTNAVSNNHLIVPETLSIGAIITAVGAVYVTREKALRNERDLEQHKKEIAQHKKETKDSFDTTMLTVGAMLKDHRDLAAKQLAEHRREMREDSSEMRDKVHEIVSTVGRIEGVVQQCPRCITDHHDRYHNGG